MGATLVQALEYACRLEVAHAVEVPQWTLACEAGAAGQTRVSGPSARGDNGGVNDGLLDPYSASMGRSSAAAMCISPESLDTTTWAPDSRSTASSRLVRPHRLRQRPPLSCAISAPMARSFDEPISQTC